MRARTDRGDVPRGTSEVFFRKVKFEKSIAPVFVSCSAKQQPSECVLVLVLVKYGTINRRAA